MNDQMMDLLTKVAKQPEIASILKGDLNEKSLAPLLKLAQENGINITPAQLTEVIKTFNEMNKGTFGDKVKKLLRLK